ncbi:hypothetical protein DV737_g827, partial [Chaetothyriales sp. CBS 132003]
MLIESFIAATSAPHKAPQHLAAALKDVGICQYEFQPQPGLRQGFKKSSVGPNCLALSKSHIFAAQLEKAVINVYSRDKANQEATVPFPERVRSLVFVEAASVLVIGTESGKLILWEVATGRLVTSSASHLHAVSSLHASPNNDYLLSGSPDATVCVWSLPLLLSFPSSSTVYGGQPTASVPSRTFSAHLSPITALSCGHSRSSTNFAISASEDKTCYIWHIDTCEIIRTLLLPSTALCATLDPVDRAIYFGSKDGGIMTLNLQSLAAREEAGGGSSCQATTVELLSTDTWTPASQLGATNAIALSYDATSLLSAHTNGAVVQWDVAKQTMASEIFNFAQPVTNIQMLRPQGLSERKMTAYETPAIVKPRLELNNVDYSRTSSVPIGYSLHVSLTRRAQCLTDQKYFSDELGSMATDGWSDGMLDDAIHAIETAVDGPQQNTGLQAAKSEKLQEEVAALKQQIAVMHKVEQKRMAKTFNKLQRLDAVDTKRKQAYFDAKTQGRDGDAAMKPFDKEIDAIRGETGGHDEMDTS